MYQHFFSPKIKLNPPMTIHTDEAIPGPNVIGNSRSFHSQLKGLSVPPFDELFALFEVSLFSIAAADEIQ